MKSHNTDISSRQPRQSVGGGKFIQKRTTVRYPLLKPTAFEGGIDFWRNLFRLWRGITPSLTTPPYFKASMSDCEDILARRKVISLKSIRPQIGQLNLIARNGKEEVDRFVGESRPSRREMGSPNSGCAVCNAAGCYDTLRYCNPVGCYGMQHGRVLRCSGLRLTLEFEGPHNLSPCTLNPKLSPEP